MLSIQATTTGSGPFHPTIDIKLLGRDDVRLVHAPVPNEEDAYRIAMILVAGFYDHARLELLGNGWVKA